MTPPGPHCIETASGRYVDLLAPDPRTIALDDIAHHLATITRFTGAARRPVSVGEHTLLVAGRLSAQGHDAATVLRGLHHDDAEAYAGDVSRPLKLILGDAYRAVETRLMDAISDALRLPAVHDWGAVRAADDWALAAEAYHLLPSRGQGWSVSGAYRADDPGDWMPTLQLSVERQLLDWRMVKWLWLRSHDHWKRDAS